MWINEGFARYGEYLCYEALDPTLEKYKSEIKKLHFQVLRSDGGHYALDNVPPPNATYGSTTYDKGGLVAYTLRNYMGDEKYFAAIKQFLNNNQYKNVDSEAFFQQLTDISGIDLTDFYLGWVHQPGFLNFNIDSIKPVAGTNNKYELSLKQKLYQAQYFADNNKIDVEFISALGEKHLIESISFSGEHEMKQVEIPFEPVFWCIDPDGKMGDACFDYTQQITKTGLTSLSNANFEITVDEFSETSILRVEHNPVAPTPSGYDDTHIVKISDKHFWRIGFLQYNDMQATYSFTYDSKYDGGLLQGYTYYDLIVLYRKDASCHWQMLPTTVTVRVSGANTYVYISVNSILAGEYTLGIGKDLSVKEWEDNIKVYPNPTTGELRIENGEWRINNIEIYDISGKEIILNSQFSILNSIDISHLPTGIYILQISTENNKTFKKIIKL
jgi:aminopeptidase N